MVPFKEIRTIIIISSSTLQELLWKMMGESTNISVLVFCKRRHIYLLVMQGGSNTSRVDVLVKGTIKKLKDFSQLKLESSNKLQQLCSS